jgi:translation initiation factor IF-3
LSDKYAEGVTPKQPVQKLHTLKFHLNIGDADRERLIRKAGEFLIKKSQVKILVQLRGREKANPMRGVEFLNQIIEELREKGSPANIPNTTTLFVTFNPKKKS